MARFDWRYAAAWTGVPMSFGAGAGFLAHGLWLTLDKLRTGSPTRSTLFELLAIIGIVMLLWWLAALCRAASNRARIEPFSEPARTFRRVVVRPPDRGSA